MTADRKAARRAVLFATAMGLFSVLSIAWSNGTLLLDEEESGATTLGAIAFVVAYLAPFLVLVASLRRHDISQQRAMWLGCTLCMLCLNFLAMYSFGIFSLLIALLIGWAWRACASEDSTRWNWLSPLLTLWIAVAFGSALLYPILTADAAACWTGNSWERTESFATFSSTVGTCSSDIITSVEGAVAIGAVALGILGIVAILRLWQPDDLQPPAERRLTQELNPR
jgi:hypothetical protein